jgi:hypothetical protein
VQWDKPDENSDTITEYRIEAQLADTTWTEICDGTDATIISNLGCLIPMSTFWEPTTFNKDYLDLVQFRITAYNVNGWGLASEPNTSGALVLTVPRYMNPPIRNVKTYDERIFLDWLPITTQEHIGGSAILSYGLQWDDATNGATWVELHGYVSNTQVLEFSTTDVVPGAVYQVKLQAKNIYGWGEFSSITLVAASGVPHQMLAATTQNNGENVLISWVAPDNNSDELIGFRVFIRDSANGIFENDYCLMELSPNALSCEVPMTSLYAAPFNLV